MTRAKQILTEIDEAYKRVTGTDNNSKFPTVYSELAWRQLFHRLDDIEDQIEDLRGDIK